jgi:hypothetical protein
MVDAPDAFTQACDQLFALCKSHSMDAKKLAIARSLLERYPELIHARDKQASGATPLHLSITQDTYDLTRLLLSHMANIEALDNDGLTPLAKLTEYYLRERYMTAHDWFATSSPEREALEEQMDILIKAGADYKALTCNQTPSLLALFAKDVVSALVPFVASGASLTGLLLENEQHNKHINRLNNEPEKKLAYMICLGLDVDALRKATQDNPSIYLEPAAIEKAYAAIEQKALNPPFIKALQTQVKSHFTRPDRTLAQQCFTREGKLHGFVAAACAMGEFIPRIAAPLLKENSEESRALFARIWQALPAHWQANYAAIHGLYTRDALHRPQARPGPAL